MKVLVAVAEVAEVADDFEIVDGVVDDAYLERDMNEWDEYALEAGVQVAEANDAEVVTATVGPERVEETIRKALAKGADRAIRVWDDALADADLVDVGAKAAVLAAVVEREEPDLVLTGVQASDDAFGATGVALAERVGYGWAAVVNALDVDRDAGVAGVRRELEGGVEELTEVSLPAVLTIQTGINEPRYASLRGIRQAQGVEVETFDLGALGLTADAVEGDLRLTGMRKPETGGDTEFVEGTPEEQATRLADVLRDAGVVGE